MSNLISSAHRMMFEGHKNQSGKATSSYGADIGYTQPNIPSSEYNNTFLLQYYDMTLTYLSSDC